MNLYLENINMDSYNLLGGFDNYIVCNYPEAFLDDHMIVKNLTVYNSQARQFDITGRFLSYFGSGNFTLDTADISAYGTNINEINHLEIKSDPSCNPKDTAYRVIDVGRIKTTLPDNPYEDRFTETYIVHRTDGYSRIIDIKYHDNTHIDIANNRYSIVSFFLLAPVSVYITN